MSVRIFEGSNHANIYAKFRPVVPNNVIEYVLNFLREKIDSTQWDIAVDVGCGSGQGTNKLSNYFKHCYGFDVSQAQINEAKESNHSNNVEYNVSDAENLPNIRSNSVQLLTAFEAAHWFDFQEFIKESDRILVDNGVIALIGYMLPDVIDPLKTDNQSLTQVLYDGYFDPRLAPYKNPKIVGIENHYLDFKFPENYEVIYRDNILYSIDATAQDIIGYYESWSLYQGLVAHDKQLADQCLEEIKQKYITLLGTSNLSEKKILLNFMYFLVMGRKIK